MREAWRRIVNSKAEPLSWRQRILILILSPLVVLGLVELGLRIAGYRYEPWRAHLDGRTHHELQQLQIYQPHPELIWTLRRSDVLQVEGFRGIRTNAQGLRGSELPGPRGPDELRVLCLGDSVTFCLGLPDGSTWPERLAEALERTPEVSGKKITVVNGAVPGWSSIQGMRLLDRLDEYDPDVIVFWYGLADASPMRELPDSMVRIPAGKVSLALRTLWKLRVFQLVQDGVTKLRRSSRESSRVSRAEYRANVERLLELERSGGPRVIFVREPECLGVTMAQLETVVAQAEAAGVEVVHAPTRLLQWIAPAPACADLRGRVVRKGTAIRFPPSPEMAGYDRVDKERRLDEIRADLELLRERKAVFEGLIEALPADSLDYEDLFGEAPLHLVLTDNCHLSPRGAVLAAAAIARRAVAELEDR